VPPAIPVTTPVKPFTVATAGDDDVHTPPTVGIESEVVPFTQTDNEPVITPGFTLTVKTRVAVQPAADK
jgi:hypothetical protein